MHIEVAVKSLRMLLHVTEEAHAGWLSLAGGPRRYNPNTKAPPTQGRVNRHVIRETCPKVQKTVVTSPFASCALCVCITGVERPYITMLIPFSTLLVKNRSETNKLQQGYFPPHTAGKSAKKSTSGLDGTVPPIARETPIENPVISCLKKNISANIIVRGAIL